MRRRIPFVLLFCFLFNFPILAHWGQDDVKFLLIKRIIKSMEWPDHSQEGEFKIGIYGSRPFYRKINFMIIKPEHVNGKNVAYYLFENESELLDCQLIYIPLEFSKEAGKIASHYKGKPTLVMVESTGPINNQAGVNILEKEDGTCRFKLIPAVLDQSGISYSSRLVDESGKAQ